MVAVEQVVDVDVLLGDPVGLEERGDELYGKNGLAYQLVGVGVEDDVEQEFYLVAVHVSLDLVLVHPSMLGSELQDGVGTVVEVIRVLAQEKSQQVSLGEFADIVG